MASGSVTVPPGEPATPLNFIYACSVCCYTFADVYEGHNKTVEGFSDGINPKERVVTHLYLASCCHVFCGSHLEGGAPPFHPEGQRPKAPCPTCVREKKDSEPRDLYSIRGFHSNEHDPMIPPAWFDAPPINFDGNGKGIEALRFQYLALVRYCQNVHATRKPLQDALAQAEQRLTSIQDLTSKEHAKVLTLQQENQLLEDIKQKYENAKVELERLHTVEREVEQYRRLDVNRKDLETFKNNKDAIRHYLKLVPTLIEQNDKMRKRLASLGFAMALEPVPNLKGFDLNALNDDGGINCDYYGTSGTSLPNTTSSHTAGRSAGRSAQTPGNAITASSSPFIQRPLKRQRIDSPLPNNTQVEPPTSRDAMPPPRKPVSRMRSVRKMFPTLKKKFTGAHSSKASAYDSRGVNDVHMYEDGPWDSTVSVSAINGPTVMRHEAVREEPQYMSGALPAESPQHGANQRGSQPFSSVGAENDAANFTFRGSSPVRMDNATGSHRPVQPPSEPSYIRLMDGLSRDNGVELGLKDPRDYASSSFEQFHSNGRDTPYLQDPRNNTELDARDDRYQGSSYRYQSPHELPHFRINDSNTTHANHTSHMDGTYQDILRSPLTPAPKTLNRPGRQIDIVSPYIQRSSRDNTHFSRPRIAEPQGSSNRFADYRSPKPRMIMPEPDPGQRNSRGLNGLSFFESPVISDQQQSQSSHARRQIDRPPPSRHYHSRDLAPGGLITTAEAGRSPFFHDSAYGSARDRSTFFSQQHIPSSSAIPFPSFTRSANSRLGQVPSIMPSIISSHSPVRTRPQWEALQRMGVRSSRRDYSKDMSSIYANPTRHTFSSVGRRSVRR